VPFHDSDFVVVEAVELVHERVDLPLPRGGVSGGISAFGSEV
jgi:hypothetical protein